MFGCHCFTYMFQQMWLSQTCCFKKNIQNIHIYNIKNALSTTIHGSNRNVKLIKCCACCASQGLTVASSLKWKIQINREGKKALLTQLRRKHKDETMTSLCERDYWRFRIAPAPLSLNKPSQWRCPYHACALAPRKLRPLVGCLLSRPLTKTCLPPFPRGCFLL